MDTALALVTHLDGFHEAAPRFSTPIKIIHGDHDRVTSHHQSLNFIANAGSTDKDCTIYEGLEHAMCRDGGNEKDEEVRLKINKERDEWYLARVNDKEE